MQPSSATDATPGSDLAERPANGQTLASKFAEALGGKDFGAVIALLDPEIDFRGLTPGRAWEATTADALDRILRQWFEDTDELDEISSIEVGSFADRERVSYRFRGHNADGPFGVEQQVYYTESDGRNDWMRILSSGFRPG